MSDDPYRRLFGPAPDDPYAELFGPKKDEWVRRGIVEVNTRTGETRAARVYEGGQATVPVAPEATPEPGRFAGIVDTKSRQPRSIPGGVEAVTPVARPEAEPLTLVDAVARGAFGPLGDPDIRSRVKEMYASLIDLPAAGQDALDAARSDRRPEPLTWEELFSAERGRTPATDRLLAELSRPGPDRNPLRPKPDSVIGTFRESVRQEADARRERLLETLREHPELAAAADTGQLAIAVASDPANLLGAGAESKAATEVAERAAQRLAEARSVVAPTAAMADTARSLPRATSGLRAVPDDLLELAAKSQGIGLGLDEEVAPLARATEAPRATPSRPAPRLEVLDMTEGDGPTRTLRAFRPDGTEAGSLRYTRHPDGGFVVGMVRTEGAGTGAGRALYRAAAEDAGPYRGAWGRTPEGEGFVSRLRQTDPEIFAASPDYGPPLPKAAATVTQRAPAAEAGYIRTNLLQSLDRWMTENLTSGGQFKAAAKDFTEPAQRDFVAGLPKKIEGMQGAYQVQMDEARRLQGQLLNAAKESGLKGPALRRAMEDVTAVRLGEKPLDTLPEAMHGPALDLFQHIDGLTQEMVDSGMLTDAQKQAVTGNFGNYLHRGYRMFDEKGYLAKTEGTPAWNNAFDYLRKELGTGDQVGSRIHTADGRAGRITSLTDDGRAFVRFDDSTLRLVDRSTLSGASDDEIAGMLRALIDRDAGGPIKVLTVPGGPRQLNAILQERHAIPPELRAVMGEYRDIRTVAERTVHNMAWDLATYRFFKETADEGRALGVFRPKGNPSGEVYAKIVGEGQDTLGSRGALAELLTTPGLKRALEGTFEEVRSTWWSRAAGKVKAMKTVGSIQTQARNFLSHGITTIANGHNPGNLNRYRSVARILKGEELATRRQAVRLGIINEGAASREIESYVRELEEGGAVSRGLARIAKPAQKAYKVADDFWRTYNWLAETEDMMVARGLSRPEAEALAADRVRDTFQTYGRAPLLAAKLRRNPLVGAFPTFYIESVRNLGNLALLGAADIREGVQTGNAALVRLGMKKYLGLATATGSAYAIYQLTRDQVGVSKEEDDAFRRLVAPAYMQNAELLYTKKEAGKSYTAFEWSFLNPYAAVAKPVIATQRAIEEGQPPVQAVYELLDSIAGGELLATTLAETVMNQRIQDVYPFRLGGKISLPDQGLAQVSKDRAYHLYRAMAPGAVTSAENLLRGAGVLSPTTESGKTYDLGRETLALAGPRITTFEVKPALKRAAVDASTRLREGLADARNTAERLPDSTPQQAAILLKDQENVYRSIRQAAQDGLTLGVPREEVFEALRRGMIPEDMAAAALLGQDFPPPPSLEPKTPAEMELLRQSLELWRSRYQSR